MILTVKALEQLKTNGYVAYIAKLEIKLTLLVLNPAKNRAIS